MNEGRKEEMSGWMDVWMGGWVDGWMEEWGDGWMEGGRDDGWRGTEGMTTLDQDVVMEGNGP